MTSFSVTSDDKVATIQLPVVSDMGQWFLQLVISHYP